MSGDYDLPEIASGINVLGLQNENYIQRTFSRLIVLIKTNVLMVSLSHIKYIWELLQITISDSEAITGL